jgi:hypothetical protein
MEFTKPASGLDHGIWLAGRALVGHVADSDGMIDIFQDEPRFSFVAIKCGEASGPKIAK